MTTAVATSNTQSLYDSLNAKDASKLSALDEAQNRFLTLLTTQLRNQDPMNPLDNAEMTSQLAQISTVNGIEKLNASLQALLSNITDSQAMQAANLVNHGVLVPGSSLTLGESGAIGGLELTAPTDETIVTIKDANGLVIRTLDLGALATGIHPFAWDGKNDGAAQAALGKYSYSVSAKTDGKDASASALTFGLVQAITRGSGGLSLDLGTLGAYTLNDVKQIL